MPKPKRYCLICRDIHTNIWTCDECWGNLTYKEEEKFRNGPLAPVVTESVVSVPVEVREITETCECGWKWGKCMACTVDTTR